MKKSPNPEGGKTEREIEAFETVLSEPVKLVEKGGSRFLIYETRKGTVVELRYAGEKLWLSQGQMADLFGVQIPAVSKHLKNIFESGELSEEVVVSILETTTPHGAIEGKTQIQKVNVYSLDAIISVGYRVSSVQGTLFRRWATSKLVQFATKGFVIDKERLKAPEDQDHIAELREIIREIRASTTNLHREVKRICSLCQDYDGSSETSRNFYAGMENKLLYLCTSQTAPELILDRADHTKPDMGLTSFPKDAPRQQDALIANNYLSETEAKWKNRATSMLLDYFEEQLDQGKLVTMVEAQTKLDQFIKFNGWSLLTGLGSVSRKRADEYAKGEYQKFRRLLAE